MLYPWQYQKEKGHLGIQRHSHLSQGDTQVMFHSKEDQKEKVHLRSFHYRRNNYNHSMLTKPL